MKGYAKPTTEVLARISELRATIRDIYATAKREGRDKKPSEIRKIDKASNELHRLEGGDER